MVSRLVEAYREHFNLGRNPPQSTKRLYGLGGLSFHHRDLKSFGMSNRDDIEDSDILYLALDSNEACELQVPPKSHIRHQLRCQVRFSLFKTRS